MRHPGPQSIEPGSKTEESCKKLTGHLRIRYQPGHWVYDANAGKNVYVEPIFYSYIDYGVTSAWFGN